MKFIDTILILVAAATGVLSSYFAGHAISSEHGAWAWITAAVLLVVALAAGLLAIRRVRRSTVLGHPPDARPM